VGRERGKIGQQGLGQLKHGVCEIVVLSWILCFSVRGGICSFAFTFCAIVI
jgi:hypothetical protein